MFLLACTAASEPIALGAPREAPVVVTLDAVWGLEFGKDPAAALGPLALVPDGEGFAVLDQEHLRLRRYDQDGIHLADVAIPSAATLDATRIGDDFAVLSYHRLPSPGWDAHRLGDASESLAVDVPTGIFADGETLLVEERHAELIDVETGARVFGRPDGQGGYVRARRDSLREIALEWHDGRSLAIVTDRPIVNLLALQPAGSGLMIAMMLADEGVHMGDPELRIGLIEGDALRDEISLPTATVTDVHRPLAMSAGGRLFQLRTDDAGVAVARVDPP